MPLGTCTSSGLLSASAVILNRPCRIHAVTIVDAAAACTLLVYDNATTNSGTVVAAVNATVNASTGGQTFTVPVECSKGAYAAITGTSAGYIVHFSPL